MNLLLYIDNGVFTAKPAYRELKELTVSRAINVEDSNKHLFSKSVGNFNLNLTKTPDVLNTALVWSVGTEIEILAMGAGSITIIPATNVTIKVYKNAPLTLLGGGAVGVLKLIYREGIIDNWLFIGQS